MPPGAENHNWTMWNATDSGASPARSLMRRPSPIRLDAGAPVGTHRGGVRGERGDVDPVAGGQFEIALVGIKDDRAHQAEQHLVLAMVMSRVAVARTVAPRS